MRSLGDRSDIRPLARMAEQRRAAVAQALPRTVEQRLAAVAEPRVFATCALPSWVAEPSDFIPRVLRVTTAQAATEFASFASEAHVLVLATAGAGLGQARKGTTRCQLGLACLIAGSIPAALNVVHDGVAKVGIVVGILRRLASLAASSPWAPLARCIVVARLLVKTHGPAGEGFTAVRPASSVPVAVLLRKAVLIALMNIARVRIAGRIESLFGLTARRASLCPLGLQLRSQFRVCAE
mmetsp:Transcript_11843/g.30131  ORF Transcript_11843/g.30131 Transcript_11843/m.30131 type:complete len:239 (-) Transcript_11843:236-952(-)